jgi:hypothetical protein
MAVLATMCKHWAASKLAKSKRQQTTAALQSFGDAQAALAQQRAKLE